MVMKKIWNFDNKYGFMGFSGYFSPQNTKKAQNTPFIVKISIFFITIWKFRSENVDLKKKIVKIRPRLAEIEFIPLC